MDLINSTLLDTVNSGEDTVIIDPTTTTQDSIKVPKFIQAVLTLILCGILLIFTLGVIRRLKRCCPGSKKVTNDCENNADDKCNVQDSTDIKSHEENKIPMSTLPCPDTVAKSGQSTPKANRSSPMPQRPPYVRRESGPFGEDRIAFFGESYKKKDNKPHYDRYHPAAAAENAPQSTTPEPSSKKTGEKKK